MEFSVLVRRSVLEIAPTGGGLGAGTGEDEPEGRPWSWVHLSIPKLIFAGGFLLGDIGWPRIRKANCREV